MKAKIIWKNISEMDIQINTILMAHSLKKYLTGKNFENE